jgi:NAD(P)-dependent dehydrogenase (short-subunit alcohol dehydrogenase family)
LSDAEIRRLFDTNVFGTMAVTRAVLPHMRGAGRGRIVMITSVGGRIGTYGVGAYCATKFAQEGFAESLAQEVAPFGIQVAIVEPGIIRTEAWTINRVIGAGARDPRSPYAAWFGRSEELADRMVRSSPTTAGDVAAAVHDAVTARTPRLRTLVGRRARIVSRLRRYVPGELFDRLYFGAIVKRVTGSRAWPPRPARPPGVVLVTGASGALGRATVARLARAGWTVFAGIRDLNLAPEIEALGAGVRAVQLDVTSSMSIERAVADVVSSGGRIDALVNNAGLYMRGFFEDLSDADVRQVFDVNVFGTMAVTRAVLPHMRRAGRGRVITISSVAGRSGSLIASAYCASKFALEGFGESLAMELAPWGIDAALVQPAILQSRDWGGDRGAAPGALLASSPYRAWFERACQLMDRVARSSPTDTADVAAVVAKALATRRPRLRYLVGTRARLVFALRRYVPGDIADRFLTSRVIRHVTQPRRTMMDASSVR